MKRDRIFLHGLSYQKTIGVYRTERDRPQEVIVNLELRVDVRPAAATDRLADAVDYERVCRRVEQVVAAYEGRLLEGLGERIAATLLESFDTDEVVVRLSKPAVLPEARSFGVEVVRTREEAP